MKIVKLDCHMCKGEGKYWILENEKPVKVHCEYCDGSGGFPQPVTDEEYERFFYYCDYY